MDGNATGSSGLGLSAPSTGYFAGTSPGAASGGASGMAAAWPLAVVAGMFMSNKLYGQGINQFGRQGAGKVLGIGNQIETSILGKIVGDKWANILTGAPVMTYTLNKLFGRTLKDAGIEGAFGGESGFEGRRFEFYKGGLFRSNKTKYSELDEETRSMFGDMFKGLKDGVVDMAANIGLGGEALDTFTSKIKLSLMGLSKEDADKKVAESFKALADEMAAVVLQTDKYTQGEETRSETLARLSTRMVAVNTWLEVMGDKLLEVSVVGADMASSLVDQFGGDSGFSSAIQSFVGKYFSQTEQIDLINKQVGDSLRSLGIDSVPQTREALKDLINAQDLTTEAGRKAYAALLGVADVLDIVYSAAEQLADLNLDLDIELLRAQGRETDALALERERRIKELLPYGDEVVSKQRQIWAEQDRRTAEQAAAEAAAAARSLAMRNLEMATGRDINALNAQKAALAQQRTLHNESLSLITSIFQLVKSNAEDLYGDVESVVQMQATQGRAFITDALFAARKTGYLPEHDKLSEAISAARAGINDGAYATQFERDADVLKLAGQLSALEEISGKQKTFEELQLEALDNQILAIDKQTKLLQDQLALAKEALAIAQGEYDATISTNEALAKFYALVDAHFNPAAVDGQASGATGGPVIGGGVAGKPVTSGPTGSGGYYREVKTGTGAGATDPANDLTNYIAVTYQRCRALAVPGGAPLTGASNTTGLAASGVKTVNPAPAAGVRTQIVSVSGRGRARFASVQFTLNSAPVINVRFEIIIDGRTVLDFTGINGGVTYPSWTLIGGMSFSGAPYVPMLDEIYFRRSFEFYVTPSVAMPATWNFNYAYDEEA